MTAGRRARRKAKSSKRVHALVECELAALLAVCVERPGRRREVESALYIRGLKAVFEKALEQSLMPPDPSTMNGTGQPDPQAAGGP
jgi:hypothetical protein